MKNKKVVNLFPKKKVERSRDEPATQENTKDETPPPELAKTYTAAEAREKIAVALAPIETRWMETTIFGEDLIVHRWSEKAMKEMLANQQMNKAEKNLAKQNRAPKNPEEEFQGARYHWDKKDWFPANGIKKAMVSAGYALGIPRAIIQRSVFVIGDSRRDYVEIKYKKLVKREDAVQVGPFGKRTADLRYRPEYQNWSAFLRIKYRTDTITAEQVVMLLKNAGFSIGIGEWRPEKGGQAGTFEVEQTAVKAKRRKHVA
jgi:hypothetical protein